MKNQNLKDFQKKMSFEYLKTYSDTVLVVVNVVAFKKFLTEPSFSFMAYLILVLSTSVLHFLKIIYSYNEFTKRFTPFCYAILSYFGHSYMLFKKSDQFNVSLFFPGNEDSAMIQISKDQLFRFIFQIAGMALN